MTKFKEGKIPYFNKLKYLSEEKQAEGIAILERAYENREKIMYDRFQLKNIQRSIDYHAQRLFELRVEEWTLKVKLANLPETEEVSDDDTDIEDVSTDDSKEGDASEGYGVPDYEGDDTTEDKEEDLI